MQANCKVVWHIEPEVIPESCAIVQVWTCITKLANIFYSSVSLPVNILPPHKPLCTSNHVIMLKKIEHKINILPQF